MWAIARYDLHLTDDEFYSLTPRMLSALVDRYERKTEHTEFMFGQLTAYMVNTSMAAPKKPTSPKDYMPSQWAQIQPKRERMSKSKRQKVADKLSAIFV